MITILVDSHFLLLYFDKDSYLSLWRYGFEICQFAMIVNYCIVKAGAKVLFALRQIYFQFLSNCKEYDRSDSFPFNYEPNGISFGS